MTYYKFYTTTGGSIEPQYDNTLEGTALQMKRLKSNIDSLNSKYEILMDEISVIKERQKDASKRYGELKKQLVELAVDDNEADEDID